MYLPAGTELHSRYVIETVLGHGGFGITYRAYDQTLTVRVAIKEYLPRQLASRGEGQVQVSVYSGEARQHFDYGLRKFLEEAQSVARFAHHPNVVSARDYFEAHGTAYMVMEYVEGVTLKEYLGNKGGRISFEEAKGIMMPVMDALREVHQAGMLHRDISPDNIYITTGAQVKILDFGAARYFAGEQSKSLSVILKSGYAPEEQYRSSGKQGAWTDVYAVGATIYKVLTGQTPPDALDRMAEDTLTPPSRLGADMPPAAEQVLLKALAVTASQRFQTMGEFQESLNGQLPMTGQVQPETVKVDSPRPAEVHQEPTQEKIIQEPFQVPVVKSPVAKTNSAVPAILVSGVIIAIVIIVSSIFRWTQIKTQGTSPITVTAPEWKPFKTEFSQPAPQLVMPQASDPGPIPLKADPSQALVDQGRNLLKNKDFGKARDVLEKAIKLNPQNIQAYLALGDSYTWLLRYADAMEAYKEVIKRDAKNTNVYQRIGLVYNQQGRYREAIDYLKTALTYNPNFAQAQQSLGYAYASLGNIDGAREQHRDLEKQDKQKAADLLTFINKKAMEKKAPPVGVESVDYMQVLNAQVKSIKLFETGKEAIPKQKRVYSNRFIKSATRFLFYEIILSHPRPNRRIEFPVKSVWRHSDGSLIRELSFQGWIEPNWRGYINSNGLGLPEYGVYWPVGNYRVDLYIGDKKVGSQAFQVVER